MWKPCWFVLFYFLAISHKEWMEHLKLCNGPILLKCFRLAALKDCKGAVLTSSSSSCQTQILISWDASESLEGFSWEKQLCTTKHLSKHFRKMMNWTPTTINHIHRSQMRNLSLPSAVPEADGHKVHQVRIPHSSPWQTFGSHPNVVNIFAAKQLWGIMLCLFSLTPPQWAYIFVFPCLHICSVPRGMHTLTPKVRGKLLEGKYLPLMQNLSCLLVLPET